VPDLDLEVEVSATRWGYKQGTIMTYHRISSEFDGHAIQALSKIAFGVLKDTVRVNEAFRLINDTENENQFGKFEHGYRNFPCRILLIPHWRARLRLPTLEVPGSTLDLRWSRVPSRG
jgi:hypothetical protein